MGILADIELAFSIIKEIETFLTALSNDSSMPTNIQNDLKAVLGKAQAVLNIIHAVGI